MLLNIKSKYFMKFLFDNIEEKNKLKLIKYNKSLQNTIDINLNNYIFFSGRYIEFEADGKGKEYNGYNGELIFEGEYLNGERNGKGKEYYNNGQLEFEGEYLYNYKLKGKEYNKGQLEYEGEYLYNKKWNGK